VSPEGSPSGDGTAARPYRTLDAALEAIGLQAGSETAGDGEPPLNRPLEIFFCRGVPAGSSRPRKPTYSYYVDAHPVGSEGDGSQQSPWPNLRVALAGIADSHSIPARGLRAGESIALLPRQLFTATPWEERKLRRERIARCVLLAVTLLLVIPVLALLGYLTYRALPVLSIEFVLSNPTDAMTAGGIWAPLVGTFFLVFISLLASAPIGILAGVYLNEYAPDNWLTRIINLAVVNLAGVPSIVHGLFGVGAFVYFAGLSRSLMAASFTLAVMTLPVIITSTREALASVPMAFREACWNMGATRWQTIRTIVLPNSLSGILTGVILQVSRAAGETAPILFTGAVFSMNVPDTGLRSFFPYSPWDACMALSYHLFVLSTQVPDVPEAMIYGTAVVLIGLVLAVNSLSIGLRVYLRSRKRW
jgi:phosphate transport system permease protein